MRRTRRNPSMFSVVGGFVLFGGVAAAAYFVFKAYKTAKAKELSDPQAQQFVRVPIDLPGAKKAVT